MSKVIKPVSIGIVCLILTCFVVIQLRATNRSESRSSKEKITADLKDQIIMLNDQNTKLEKKLGESAKKLEDIRLTVSENDESNVETNKYIEMYDIFVGNTDVYGEGVSIVYTPSKEESIQDTAQNIRYIVNELRNVGVEGISVNGQRLVGTSSIEAVKNKIEINEEKINSPYKIDAIGNSEMVYNGILRPGGIVDLINLSGTKITVTKKEKVTISKYSYM